MKIAICGKGGTGKSTVVAILASEFKKMGMRVIVELEKRRLPLLGKIPFSERIVKACLQGQPIELAYSGGEAVKRIEKLQTILGLQKMPTNEYKEGNENDR